MRTLGWLAAFLLGVPVLAGADDGEERFDRVRFSVERSAKVENDQVQARLVAEAEGKDPIELADTVNRTMEWALGEVRAADAVDGRTGSYQTSQKYADKERRVWFVSQELVLESTDLDALRALLGDLQARLHLRGMHFRPSDERRREAEDAMIEAALAAFRARADRVRASLGFSGWRIVEISIGPQAAPPPRPMVARGMAMAEASLAPPALEAGESDVVVHVSGTIQLER